MANVKSRKNKRQIRHRRVRAKIKGTEKRPRLSVFKSNKYVYAQLIDDENGRVLASASDEKNLKSVYEIGKLLAKKAADKKIESAVFDRGGYKFHGKILELAKGAREGGLKF